MISRAHATASHANAGRLRSQAGSQVVRVTVVLHTVDVVNRLPFEQVAAENGFHDQYVLEHMGSPGRRARMARDAAHHIARLVHSAKPQQFRALPQNDRRLPATRSRVLRGVAGAEQCGQPGDVGVEGEVLEPLATGPERGAMSADGTAAVGHAVRCVEDR